MGISTAVTAFNTKVLPASAAQITFSSMLEDGAFTASTDAAPWINASRDALRGNMCVGIPTETVYGLAANALDASAVQQIFAVKGRPSDNPLIVHVSSIRMLRALYHLPACDDAQKVLPFLGTDNAALEGSALHAALQAAGQTGEWPEIPQAYHDVIRKFWPGALTLIMPRPPCIPIEVLGGHGTTVAVRFPSHTVARAAIAACGLPLAAPSANASGRPSPTLAAHVKHDLDGRLPLIIDSGPCDVGVESTVLDAYSSNAYVDGELVPCILRPGGVTFESLQSLGGAYERLRVYRRDFTSTEMEVNPTTPGMKYRHYSPTAPVYLFVPSDASSASCACQREKMHELLAQQRGKIGVVTVGDMGISGADRIVCVTKDAADLAHRIFAVLRMLDEDEHVDKIFVQGVDESNEGMAVMNRLAKAASHHIVC
ncbi:hypothetical protein IW136_002214 [Coemansia sp. RSA 678]|nr:hypothetical protein IW136_002214 [Coemansia sp. RSA 678]